jgi:hypothetical protein
MIIIFWEMTPCGSYKNRRFGGDSYEPVPIQELTTSLCNQLALVHPEDGSDTILLLIRATRCRFPEDDNHHIHRRGNLKSYTEEDIVGICYQATYNEDKL